jgi:hypothetical protein
MGEFAEWLIYKLTDSSVSGPWPDTNLESYYFGRMVGDVLSMVIGTGKTVVGIVEVIGAIGGGAGISIGSGGTLLGEGITISVAGATAGTALAVAGSAASGRSIVSFGSDMDKYYDARMNAEGGGPTESGAEGAGKIPPEMDLQRFAKKDDIKQIESIAKEFNMTPQQRRNFGDYVESLKDIVPNNKNFSYQRLMEIAKEFLGAK